MPIPNKSKRTKNSKRSTNYLSNSGICKFSSGCKNQLGDKSRNLKRILHILRETMTITYGLINTWLIGRSKLRRLLHSLNVTPKSILAILRLINLRRKGQPISVFTLLEELALKVWIADFTIECLRKRILKRQVKITWETHSAGLGMPLTKKIILV